MVRSGKWRVVMLLGARGTHDLSQRKADSSKLKEGSDLMISYRVETLKLVPFFTTVRSSHTFRHDELELI